MGKAQSKYDKANTRHFCLKLNKRTDEDIIKKLLSVPNVQGYIKDLIKKDILTVDNK